MPFDAFARDDDPGLPPRPEPERAGDRAVQAWREAARRRAPQHDPREVRIAALLLAAAVAGGALVGHIGALLALNEPALIWLGLGP